MTKICECQNCSWYGLETELQPIKDLAERVEQGETVPAGECPKCGALAHRRQCEEQPWSVLINWSDSDQEQGQYGWAGMAFDAGDAEIKARSEMFGSHAAEQNWTEQEILEESESRSDILEFGGSVVESYPGANIWAAPDGLRALKAVMEFIDNGTPIYPGSLIVDETIKPAIARLEGQPNE